MTLLLLEERLMKTRIFVMALAVVASFAVTSMGQAQAAYSTPIADLYNTGVDASHVALAAGAVDPNYQLVSAPMGEPYAGPSAYVVSGTYPIPPWHVNLSDAQWINPILSPTNQQQFNGLYTFRTTFNTMSDPFIAEISGQITADDQVVGFILNTTSFSFSTPDQGYATLQPFSISSGFIAGLNTLDFVVNNTHLSKVGLLVEMTGSMQAIPEPTSVALLGIGMVGFFAFRRRFFKRNSVV